MIVTLFASSAKNSDNYNIVAVFFCLAIADALILTLYEILLTTLGILGDPVQVLLFLRMRQH